MKQGLVPCAAALLAVPQAARAAEPLCDQLDAFAAGQWSETADPAPRHWVEFHRGIEADTLNRWSWGCRHSGDEASAQFCDWLMDNTSREFHTSLPLHVLECMGEVPREQADSASRLIEGEVRRKAKDGSWLVLEVSSNAMRRGESAVRISFESDARPLDPEDLPAMKAFEPDPEPAAKEPLAKP